MRLLLACSIALLACSTTSGTVADSGSPDTGTPDADTDAAVGYPAPHPPMPTLLTRKGPVIASPKFVPITFMGDPLVTDIDSFVSKMATATQYWSGATAEYGVGPATSLTPIHSTDTPAATISDADIQSWLTTQIAQPSFPQPDANTIYAIFYADNITVNMGGGVGCQDFEGYHNDFMLGSQYVIYAVTPRCPPPVKTDTLTDMMGAIASHEFIEAATDPLPSDKPAYTDLDPDHLGWSLVSSGTENGDLCAPFPGVFSRTEPGMSFLVQRTWSNQAGAASHDPCAPFGVDPYFNSAPVLNDTVNFNTPQGVKAKTKGVTIPVGQSGMVELDLYSDAPTSGPWTVSAFDAEAMFKGTQPSLTFAFDKTTGQNGDIIQMTITVVKKGSSGAEVFWVQSTLGTQKTVWLGLVGN